MANDEPAKSPPDEVRHRIIRERNRNRLDDLEDEAFAATLHRAARLLPEFHDDLSFGIILRHVLRETIGDRPCEVMNESEEGMLANLRQRYLAARTTYAWLDDGTKVDGWINAASITEMARMIVDITNAHRNLVTLVRSGGAA